MPSHPHPTCPLLTSRRATARSRRSLHLRLGRTRTGRWRARRCGVTGPQAHGIRCELLRGARCTSRGGAGCICSTGVGPDFLYSSTRYSAHAPAVFSSGSPRPVLACLLLSQGLFPSGAYDGADGCSAAEFARAPGDEVLIAVFQYCIFVEKRLRDVILLRLWDIPRLSIALIIRDSRLKLFTARSPALSNTCVDTLSKATHRSQAEYQ